MEARIIDHDGLFKALLREFFYEFLRLFCPALAAAIDPAAIQFLEQEIQINLPGGRVIVADLVAKVKFHGTDLYFLIHVEHQSTATGGFPRRFFEYFAGLFLTQGLMIYPIVVYSHDAPAKPQPAEYTMSFPGFEVLKFAYQVVQLNKLDWRAYLKSDNPIASALMAKMKIAERDRPRVKMECLRLMLTMKLNPARMKLIEVFVDSYLRLNREETAEFEAVIAGTELDPKEKEKIMEMTTSWMEEGIEKGLKQGRMEGRMEGRREILLDLIRMKFGPLPESVARSVEKIASTDQLESLSSKILTATSLEQLGLTPAC